MVEEVYLWTNKLLLVFGSLSDPDSSADTDSLSGFDSSRRMFALCMLRRILFLCVTVGEELLVGVVIGAVSVRVRVRVRMIDSQPMPLPPQ